MLRSALLLLLVALLAHLPQLGVTEWRGTEGRRVQIAAEMVRSGDFMVPTLGGEPTLAKPPLHYWVLSFVEALSGHGFVAMRLPSTLAMWALAVLAFGLHRRVFGRGAAWVVALGILLAPGLLAEAPTAEIDPLFAALTAGSLFLMAHGVAGERRRLVLLSGIVGGLALLTKGPPYLLFVAGAWLVWWRHRKLRHFLLHAVPLVLVPLCYYVPLWVLRVGPAEFLAIANEESVGRLFTFQLDHVLETPFYLLRVVSLGLPLGLWGLWEFRSSRNARMGPEDLTLRMGSAAAVFAVVLLTFFPGRPTRYLLPMIPLLVFAVAPAAAHYARQRMKLGSMTRVGLGLLGAAGALALVALPFLPTPFPGRAPALALGLGLLPVLVTTPRHVVAACFLVPMLAAFTVLPDRLDAQRLRGRLPAQAGPILRAELRALGAETDLRTLGHFHSGLLLGMDLLPPGDEVPQAVPDARFVLFEQGGWPPLPPMPDHQERLRLCLRSDTYVLAERRESGR